MQALVKVQGILADLGNENSFLRKRKHKQVLQV